MSKFGERVKTRQTKALSGAKKKVVTKADNRIFEGLKGDKLRKTKAPLLHTKGVSSDIGKNEITPDDLRAVCLLASPAMEDALIQFVIEHADLLRRFRLSANKRVTTEIKAALGPAVEFASEFTLSPLGADSQCATQMVHQDVGFVVYFNDPLTYHSYQPDADALLRLINVWNVLHATNPTTAVALTQVLKEGVEGKPELIPSFFHDLESPAVPKYKEQQAMIVAKMADRGAAKTASTATPAASTTAATAPAPGLAVGDPALAPGPESLETGNLSNYSGGVTKINPSVVLRVSSKLAKLKRQADENILQNKYSETLVAQEMRCLALISHNNMKEAMQDFVIANKTVLRRFRLTGTASTMKMLKKVLGEDISYGPTCSSGPLGGDAQVSAQMCLEDIGGVIFFTDPLDAHPHMADVNSLVRLVNVNNVLHATNPTTAMALIEVLKSGLNGHPELIPSFFGTLTTPTSVNLTQASAAAPTKAPSLPASSFLLTAATAAVVGAITAIAAFKALK